MTTTPEIRKPHAASELGVGEWFRDDDGTWEVCETYPGGRLTARHLASDELADFEGTEIVQVVL